MDNHVYHVLERQCLPAHVFEYAEIQPYAKGKALQRLDKDAASEQLDGFLYQLYAYLGATVTSGCTGDPWQFSFHFPKDRLQETKESFFVEILAFFHTQARNFTLEKLLAGEKPMLDSLFNGDHEDWIVLQNGRQVANLPLSEFLRTAKEENEYYVQKSVIRLKPPGLQESDFLKAVSCES